MVVLSRRSHRAVRAASCPAYPRRPQGRLARYPRGVRGPGLRHRDQGPWGQTVEDPLRHQQARAPPPGRGPGRRLPEAQARRHDHRRRPFGRRDAECFALLWAASAADRHATAKFDLVARRASGVVCPVNDALCSEDDTQDIIPEIDNPAEAGMSETPGEPRNIQRLATGYSSHFPRNRASGNFRRRSNCVRRQRFSA